MATNESNINEKKNQTKQGKKTGKIKAVVRSFSLQTAPRSRARSDPPLVSPRIDPNSDHQNRETVTSSIVMPEEKECKAPVIIGCRPPVPPLPPLPTYRSTSEDTFTLERCATAACSSSSMSVDTVSNHMVSMGSFSTDSTESLHSSGSSRDNRSERRKHVVVELVSTERTYVAGLKLMLTHYKEPLQAVLSPIEMNTIFSVVEVLYDFHKLLLSGLEERVNQWGSNDTLIGSYFLHMVVFFRSYSTYVNNYNLAIEILTECQTKPQFKELLMLLTKKSGEAGGQSLYSYLIMPVQRIPRYILLLQDLKKHTKSEHPDYSFLAQSISAVAEIADYIDEKRSSYDRTQRVVSLSLLIQLLPLDQDVISPGREFIFEGELYLNNSEHSYMCFLFSDILYITTHMNSRRLRNKSRHLSQTSESPSLTSRRGSILKLGGSLIDNQSSSSSEKKGFRYVTHISLNEIKLACTNDLFCLTTRSGDVYHFQSQNQALLMTWLEHFSRILSIPSPEPLFISEIPLPTSMQS